MAFDQVKMLQQLRKAQKQLGKEIIEVEAGDGAVIVQITGELKIKSVKIDRNGRLGEYRRVGTLDRNRSSRRYDKGSGSRC